MILANMMHDIPGGEALADWFGRMPRFHDAELLEITFPGDGAGLLRIHAWDMTDEVDAQGSFAPKKHAVVTLALAGVSAIHCADFDMMPGIILHLDITKREGHFRIEWSASYGVSGFVAAKQVRIDLKPGKPE